MEPDRPTHSIIDQVSWLMEHLEVFLQKSFVENKSDLSLVKEDLDLCCDDIFRKTVKIFSSFLASRSEQDEGFASLRASVFYTFRDPDRLYRAFHSFVSPYVADKKVSSLKASEKELKTLDDRLAIHTSRIQELKGIISKKGVYKASGVEMSDLIEKFIESKVLGMATELLGCLDTKPASKPKY